MTITALVSERMRSKGPTNRRIGRAKALGAVVALTLGTAMGASVAGAADSSDPSGTRTGTGPNGQSVTATPVDGLPLSGSIVQVQGTGFDDQKGIYLAVCVDNGPDVAPGPCLGGAPTGGGTGSSYWISSNPPSYAIGLTTLFDEGGSFDLPLDVSSSDENTDCLAEGVTCVISTRADHTQPGERGSDVRIPISFQGQPPIEDETTTTTTTSTVPPTTEATTTTVAAPTTTAVDTPSTTTETPSSVAPVSTDPEVGAVVDAATDRAGGSGSDKAASQLAFTGSNTGPIVGAALILIATGFVFVRTTRSRTATSD